MAANFCFLEEDRRLVEDVLGTEAAEHLFFSASHKILSEFTGSREDMEVRDGLSKIVQWFGWNYAIYWKVSTSNSGKSALIWGDGHCIAPKGSNIIAENDVNHHEFVEGLRRKQALRTIRAWFGGSENEDVASKSDLVSETEMFYLTSIFYAFPFDKPSSPCQAFHTRRTIWESDTRSYSEYYQSRAFLAKAAQFKTVAFIPLKSGVVEIGSRKSISKDQNLIQIVKDILGSKFVSAKMFPKVFGQELCLGGANSCDDSEDKYLIQMAKTICRHNSLQNEMFPDDIGRELSLGVPILRSVSTHLSCNVKDDSDFPAYPSYPLAALNSFKVYGPSNVLQTGENEVSQTGENEAEFFPPQQEAIIDIPADGSVANPDKNILQSCQVSGPADQNSTDSCMESANCGSERRKLKVTRPISFRMRPISNKLADIAPDRYSWRRYGQLPIKGSSPITRRSSAPA